MTLMRALLGLFLIGAIGGGLVATGHVDLPVHGGDKTTIGQKAPATEALTVAPPAVTVARALPGEFVETVLVTGSLVPREEILVGPEVDGLRVVEVLADEGDRVRQGQVLARLVSDTLEAQLAQNTASLARSDASIAQAQSAIASADARLAEAKNAYERAQPLTKSGYLSESNMDQRESAKRTAEAALASARDGLKVATAEKAQVEAQRREIVWRRQRTDIRAPTDGIVSRRIARIGGYASGVADAMFRLIAKGEIELDAEVPETRLSKVRDGQKVRIEATGFGTVEGTVRLVSPEIDKATRLGRVRVFIGDQPGLRIGAFARGRIETARSLGLAVPSTAILYGTEGSTVQVVVDGRVRTRLVKIGLADGARTEIREGLKAGDSIVVRSGTFLRDGDAVKPVEASEPSARTADRS